ncbi:MAG: hypothetical protein K2Y37_04490 [Pirellulales bacterium]|nr:hypothetical protein [Pirellulales bacterium]
MHLAGRALVTYFFSLALCLGVASSPTSRAAEPPRWVAQVLRRVPHTEEEVAAAFDASRNASVQVAVGDPMELPGFDQETAYDVTVAGKKEKARFQYSRIPVFTYGLALTEADQQNLPAVSKGTILERIGDNYICMQIRVHRDMTTGAVYLYYKPLAAVGSYTKSGTQEFTPLMEDSVRDCRGIGLFVKPGTPLSAEAFRTFVAVSKTMAVVDEDRDAPKPRERVNYEFFIVRGRADGDRLVLHAFVTDQDRQQLRYVKPFSPPTGPDDCSVKSTMLFTEYTVAKQSPSAKVVRFISVNERLSLPMTELDKFVASAGLQGDALDNLTYVLDAMIDGKVTAPQ